MNISNQEMDGIELVLDIKSAPPVTEECEPKEIKKLYVCRGAQTENNRTKLKK